MATLMMEAGRVLGIAMRFASGYLDCAASVAGRASTHAWIEAYLPGLGWRGFDPTLGEPSSLKHIVVGVSSHPRGVMPISGMFCRQFVGLSEDDGVQKQSLWRRILSNRAKLAYKRWRGGDTADTNGFVWLDRRGVDVPPNEDHLIADLNKSMRVHGTSLKIDDETRIYGGLARQAAVRQAGRYGR